VYERTKAAFIPLGGSKTSTCEALSRVLGTFGLNSIVKKSLKLSLGFELYIIFSSSMSHCGARWTFLRRTQFPDLVANLIAVSTYPKASGLPIAIEVYFLFACFAS
jgi:hypothetical protein